MAHPFDPVEMVAVVGAGTIGASWAALFAANGLRTIVYDPDPKAEALMHSVIDTAYDALKRLDRCQRFFDNPASIFFTTDLNEAIREADIIQENGPERLGVKLDLLSQIDAGMKPNALVLSSTSGIPPSKLQEGFRCHAHNFLVGHPFNPPHLIPLVEVVGGQRTSQSAIQRAMAFYTVLGKSPIHVRKEVPGHIANRIQAAVAREIMYLVENEVADISDIDTAVELGPGLRWGVMGPSLLFHLGGGAGGAREYAEKFMHQLMTWYAPRDPVLSTQLLNKWVEATENSASHKTRSELEKTRDVLLVDFLNSKVRQSRAEMKEPSIKTEIVGSTFSDIRTEPHFPRHENHHQ